MKQYNGLLDLYNKKKEELDKEKEKNKQWEDKIREKIEEIKMTSSQINGDYFMKNYQIEVLQELLEE